MIKKIVTFILILFPGMQPLWGQKNELVKYSASPKYESLFNVKNSQIIGIRLTKQYTIVLIEFQFEDPYVQIGISSKTRIESCSDKTSYPILLYGDGLLGEEFELDKIHSIDAEKLLMNLVFERIPPGIEKINLELPIIKQFNFSRLIWKGISINNPENPPNTGWTERSLKKFWKENGSDSYEGIYKTKSISSPLQYANKETILDPKPLGLTWKRIDKNNPKKYNIKKSEFFDLQKISLKREGLNYQLIYLSGAKGKIWKKGEVKGYITETVFPELFKVKYYLNNKTVDENYYMSFEKDLMKLTAAGNINPGLVRFLKKRFPAKR